MITVHQLTVESIWLTLAELMITVSAAGIIVDLALPRLAHSAIKQGAYEFKNPGAVSRRRRQRKAR